MKHELTPRKHRKKFLFFSRANDQRTLVRIPMYSRIIARPISYL